MSQKLRCKMKITEITKIVQYNNQDARTIKLTPVISGSKENDEFYKTTPIGNFTFTTYNIDAVDNMDIRKEYYVDIIPVE